MRSTIDRSSNCPPAPTIIQPRPASQQRSCRAFRKRSTSAPSCTSEIDMQPVRSRQPFAGVGAEQPGARRAARHPRHATQGRQHREQCRPEAAEARQLGGDIGGHALGVEIEQRERRLPFAVDDVGAGAGDDVWLSDTVRQLRFGDDLYFVRASPVRSAPSAIAWF